MIRCVRLAACGALLSLATGIALADTAVTLDTAGGARRAVCESRASAVAGQVPSFAQAAARNAQSVVTVIVIRPRREAEEGEGEGPVFFQSMSAAAPASAETPERAFSSGFVLDAQGWIATSSHAVARAREVWVILADGRQVRARVQGVDRLADVALLRVSVDGLVAVQVAPQVPCAGEWVASLGSPFGFESTLSAGVVSAYPRVLPGSTGVPLIQTDVALNPGSSGGPLLDAEGRVVGMNAMIYSDSGIYMGVAFHLPIDLVMRVAGELRAHGFVRRSGIGARLQEITPQLAEAFGLARARGALVLHVSDEGPAHEAGLRHGDIVTGVAGRAMASRADIDAAIAAAPAGLALALEIWRDRAVLRIDVRPVEEAQDAAAPATAVRAATGEARLGLRLLPPSARAGLPPGAYVDAVDGSSLLAGIETGDRIVAVNGIDVATPDDFDAALAGAARAPTVALLVVRASVPLYIAVRRIAR